MGGGLDATRSDQRAWEDAVVGWESAVSVWETSEGRVEAFWVDMERRVGVGWDF